MMWHLCSWDILFWVYVSDCVFLSIVFTYLLSVLGHFFSCEGIEVDWMVILKFPNWIKWWACRRANELNHFLSLSCCHSMIFCSKKMYHVYEEFLLVKSLCEDYLLVSNKVMIMSLIWNRSALCLTSVPLVVLILFCLRTSKVLKLGMLMSLRIELKMSLNYIYILNALLSLKTD